MGSLFLIVVPIRSHELKLRLIENDILNAAADPVAPPATGEKALVERMKTLMNIPLSAKTIPVKDITLPNTKDDTKAYSINKSGGKELLQLTRDTMKLNRAEEDHHHHRRRSVTSNISKSFLHEMDDEELDIHVTSLINSQFLEKHMEEVLEKLDLLSSSWETSIDGKFSLISFTTNEAKADRIINHIQAFGIGKKYESILSVCATSVFSQESKKKKAPLDFGSDEEETEGKWSNFVQSIKARLTVAQVVQSVKANAIITFDFLVMLIVAGIIAALGLLESSPVNLIASMLVSPLMGPIMAITFGAVIRDWELLKTGLLSEMYGLLMCLVIGMIFGISLELKLWNGPWADVERWPTAEMLGRGQLRSLIVGAGVAIPSGAGVALAILAGNAGSLVGVAISASLLPPAVNCGIFYGLALVIALRETAEGNNPWKYTCHQHIGKEKDFHHWRGHNVTYCRNALREFAAMGSVSLCLTFVNIVLIFITSIIILKIKEVAPHTTRKVFERFWKFDIGKARAYNKKHGNDGVNGIVTDLANDPNVLHIVKEDFVFNQVRTRAMYRDENVINQVKHQISKADLLKPAGVTPSRMQVAPAGDLEAQRRNAKK